eukprot:9399572-Heterocapsa_arctica.AAC.1
MFVRYAANAASATCSVMRHATRNTRQPASHTAYDPGPGISFAEKVPSCCGIHDLNFKARTVR